MKLVKLLCSVLFMFLLVNLGTPAEAQNFDVENTLGVYPSEPILDDELRILSWNIKMLPRLVLRVRYGPIKRSRLIPEQIIADKADIIVFQEAFDVRCRRILKRRLKKEYPYHYGPANNPFFSLRTNSGVMIFSKIPLEKLGQIRYSTCDGADCFAKKGVLMVEGTWKGVPFQLAGSHLEAGGTNDMKITQYQEMEGILAKFRKEGVPQIIVGDFNTSIVDTVLYPILTKTIGVEPHGPFTGTQKYTSDETINDMNDGIKQKIIDYAFYRGNGFKPYSITRHVRVYRHRWSPKYRDLSDHFAVLMRVTFRRSSEGEPKAD